VVIPTYKEAYVKYSLQNLGVIQTLIPALISVAGAIFAAFVFVAIRHGLFPVLHLKIDFAALPSDLSDQPNLLLVRLTAENRSEVKAWLQEGRSQLQVLEHQTSQIQSLQKLSDWVPFAKDSIKHNEPSKQWAEPLPVMTSTVCIEPRESIVVELLYRPSAPRLAVHCGLQVWTRRSWWLPLLRNPTERFTTTAWMLTSGETKEAIRNAA
jgi:hypothetical protein